MYKGIFVLLSLAWVFWSQPSFGQEREEILRYHSEVLVMEDGTLDVTETIQVRSLNQAISRGIFRRFPVRYRDRFNNLIKVDFEVQGVTKDGEPEPYEVIPEGDFRTIRIGQSSVILSPGVYAYEISFRTRKQIGFFEDYDELYWNAIGAEWQFPILEASARITVPPDAHVLQHAAYAGGANSSGCDCEIEVEDNRILSVKVNGGLSPNQGLTMAVAWPKGIIPAPSGKDKAMGFLEANKAIWIGLVAFLFVLFYYLWAWKKVGVDPERGTIIPLFEAPEGLDAPACRYVSRMGFDHTAFVSGIVQLAVKEVVKIVEHKRRQYRIELQDHDPEKLSETEQKIVAALFSSGATTLELTQKEHTKVGKALKALQGDLDRTYKGAYFKLNALWLLPGILVSVISVLWIISTLMDQSTSEEGAFVIFGVVFIVFLIIALSGLFILIVKFLDTGKIKWASLIGQSFFLVVLLVIAYFAWTQFKVPIPYGPLLLVLLIGVLSPIFYYLIKAPTEKGRKVMDEIEGFKMYLNAAEREMIQRFNPPEMTPEIFEKYLPYAIALGVGEAWGKTFEKQLALASVQQQNQRAYSPTWYAGTRAFNAASLGSFSKNLSSSFGTALSNSATPPGSSSGSGGGGRVGGGGGGGGGGGW
ncbi:DUF2207 domain-containing protein [Pararhodonellum marinum]|uniref:DUF2207 domain-containing protein n=1 Tax=Pararhodonellum marinum TaxID=2755358 RepID=UPI00188F482E|nr:DUF2207 domain-containing protein [Pararhodonellum marinum]